MNSPQERLTEASQANPCPHCGKPDWCYFIGELTACKRGNPPADGWEATSKADNEGTTYYAPVQEKKAIRPRQNRHWDYMDRDGNPLIRVRRFDDGEGGGSRDGKKKPEWSQYRWVNGKWVPGIEGIAREDIPIYRYSEIQEAIERNELIFIVEGEACADILGKLGLVATCNIGGSGKWRPSDSQDLSGAKVVIVPDRDEPGIKHADRIAEDFPEALWLYPFPGPAWNNPPLSKGLDIADWVEHHKITVEDILVAVGERLPEGQPKIQNLKPNNLLKHPANYIPEPAPATEIIEHADSLLEEELTPTNQIIGAIAAAKRAGLSSKDFREILAERQAEQDLDWSLIQSRENFQRLYQIEKTLINLHEYFPQALAKALLTKAESDRVDPVRILQSLLPVVGATLGARIAIEVKKGVRDKDSWKEYPIFYCADIGPPSSGKSATQNTIIEPLQEMQDAEQERAEEALIEWVQLTDVWKSMSKEEKAEKAESDENPRIYHEKYCTPGKWLFDQGSAQALTKRIAEQEAQHGCLLMQDELSGFFESFDQFTAGKGNQRQFILNAWNKPLRGGVDRVDLEASYFFRSQTLSITGTIQPDVARRVFNVATDADGMVSRFLPAIATLPRNFAKWSNVQVDIYDTMKGTIEKLRQLPECLLTMPPATKEIYIKHWESIRQLYEINLHSNPAYAFWLGKQNSYVARFAIVLHCLENLNAAELPTRVTPEIMHKAVRLSQFYCSQFLLLQSKSAQQQPLEGLLLDILKFIQQSGGQISTRDLCRSRFQTVAVEGKKLTSSTAGKLLKEIAAAGFGTFEEVKNKKIFTLNNQLSSTVMNCHKVYDSSNPSDTKALSESCHKMTEVYVSENFDSPIDFPPEAFIDESVLKPVENSEDIHSCHFMTVEGEIQSSQRLESYDSSMTVHDSYDSSTLNEAEIEDENFADCLKFIRTAISENDPQVAKDIQAILAEQAPEQKQKIWDSLTAEEKTEFKRLIGKSSTNTPQALASTELETVDKCGSDDDHMDQLQKWTDKISENYKKWSAVATEGAEQELIPIEQELLAISKLEDFSDYADWLEDPEYLENVCLSLGGEPEKLWLAHQIQNFLNLEDKTAAVEAIGNLRQHFSRQTLEAAGKMAVGGQRGAALAKFSEVVLASKVEAADAQKMRDIALVWWDEVPAQSLTNQMFARGCPGEKYPHQVIAAWIKCQEDLVRQRLVKLCRDAGRTS